MSENNGEPHADRDQKKRDAAERRAVEMRECGEKMRDLLEEYNATLVAKRIAAGGPNGTEVITYTVDLVSK